MIPCCLTQKYFKTSSCGGVLFKVIFSVLLLHWSETPSKMCFAKNFPHKLYFNWQNLVTNCFYWSFKIFIDVTMVTQICQLLLYILNNFFILVDGCWNVQPKYQKKGVDFSKTFYHRFYKNLKMLKLLVILFKTFLLRICANFYGNSNRNKKVTRFDSKLSILRKFRY